MADLAGTVVGVVAFGLQLATTLQTFTELVIEAQDALRDLVFEVNATAAALRQLQTIVDADRAFPEAQKTSRVFNDSGLREIQTLAAKCEKVYRAIVRLVLKASSSGGGSEADGPVADNKGSLVAIDASALKPMNMLKRLRWPWLIPRIGRCQEQLRWLKVSLLVTLQLANLAAQQIRSVLDAVFRFSSRLRRTDTGHQSHKEPVSSEDHIMARQAIETLRKRQGQLAPRRPLSHEKPEVNGHGEARAVLSKSAATHVRPFAPRDIMPNAAVTERRFVGEHGLTSQPTDPDRAKGFNSSAGLPYFVKASPQEPDQALGIDPRQNPYHLQRGGYGFKHDREPPLDNPMPATPAFDTLAVKRVLALTEQTGDANKQEQVRRDLLPDADLPAAHTRRAISPSQTPPAMPWSRGNGHLDTRKNIGNDDSRDQLQAIIIEHGDIRLMPFSQESLEQNLRQTLEAQSQSLWAQFLHIDAETQGLLVKGTDWARTATNRDATLVAFHRLQRPSEPDAMIAFLQLKESFEPMQFIDEAGRTFTVPYSAYHSYEEFHATMLNLLGDDEVLIAAVRDGAFQLQNEKGETIHPTLWASCVRPGAAVAVAKTRRLFLVKCDASKETSRPQAEALSAVESRPATPDWKAALLKRTDGERRTGPLDQAASQAHDILSATPPPRRRERRRRILSRLRSSVGALRSALFKSKASTSSRSTRSNRSFRSSGSSGSCMVLEQPEFEWVRRKRGRPSTRFHHNLFPHASRCYCRASRPPMHRMSAPPLAGRPPMPGRPGMPRMPAPRLTYRPPMPGRPGMPGMPAPPLAPPPPMPGRPRMTTMTAPLRIPPPPMHRPPRMSIMAAPPLAHRPSMRTTGEKYVYDTEGIKSPDANRIEGLEDKEQLLSSSDDESEDVGLGEEADVWSWSVDELLSRWTNAPGNPPLREGVDKETIH